jgi:nitroreductase
MLRGFYDGKPQLQRDEALRTVGILAQTIMLAAISLGYESCPMVGYDSEAVAKIINLPEDHLVGMIVAIGHGAQPAWPRGGSLPQEETVILDRFA